MHTNNLTNRSTTDSTANSNTANNNNNMNSTANNTANTNTNNTNNMNSTANTNTSNTANSTANTNTSNTANSTANTNTSITNSSTSSIQVHVKIRPSPSPYIPHTSTTISIHTRTYTFNHVHTCPDISPTLTHLTTAFFNHYNCSIMCYGQTGSGKTYTMGMTAAQIGRVEGIVPCMAHAVLARTPVILSFFEVYNEEVVDLLDGRRRLVLCADRDGLSIGARQVVVSTYGQFVDVVSRAIALRITKSTCMNSVSSRSHAILMLTRQDSHASSENKDGNEDGSGNNGNNVNVSNGNIVSNNIRNGNSVKTSSNTFMFVDLAGSERVIRTQVTNDRLKESIHINTGLLSLGNVINALYHRKRYVPYRDSKLTRILQPMLRTSILRMIACVSDRYEDVGETMSTLEYASRAASIKTRVQSVQVCENAVVARMREEIARLRRENMLLRSSVRCGRACRCACHVNGVCTINDNDRRDMGRHADRHTDRQMDSSVVQSKAVQDKALYDRLAMPTNRQAVYDKAMHSSVVQDKAVQNKAMYDRLAMPTNRQAMHGSVVQGNRPTKTVSTPVRNAVTFTQPTPVRKTGTARQARRMIKRMRCGAESDGKRTGTDSGMLTSISKQNDMPSNNDSPS